MQLCPPTCPLSTFVVSIAQARPLFMQLHPAKVSGPTPVEFQSLKRDPCLCNRNLVLKSTKLVKKFQSLKRDPCLCNVVHSCNIQEHAVCVSIAQARPLFMQRQTKWTSGWTSGQVSIAQARPLFMQRKEVFKPLMPHVPVSIAQARPLFMQRASVGVARTLLSGFNRSSATPVYATSIDYLCIL